MDVKAKKLQASLDEYQYSSISTLVKGIETTLRTSNQPGFVRTENTT